MLVALHGQQDFFAGEGLFEGWSLRDLRFVPLAIVLWSGVNIVRGGIAVDDFDGLAGHYSDDVRFIFAAALRQSDRLFRNVECAISDSLLHFDNNPLDLSPPASNVF